jgi:hypothetical protein
VNAGRLAGNCTCARNGVPGGPQGSHRLSPQDRAASRRPNRPHPRDQTAGGSPRLATGLHLRRGIPGDGPPSWAAIPLFALGVLQAVHHRGPEIQGRSTSGLVWLARQTSTSTTSLLQRRCGFWRPFSLPLNQRHGASILGNHPAPDGDEAEQAPDGAAQAILSAPPSLGLGKCALSQALSQPRVIDPADGPDAHPWPIRSTALIVVPRFSSAIARLMSAKW